MSERTSRDVERDRRMREPGAPEAYHAAKLAYELVCTVRGLREQRGFSQAQLAIAAGMTQSAVTPFEVGGTSVPAASGRRTLGWVLGR